MQSKRSPLTTAIGVLAITLGTIGALFTVLHIAFVLTHMGSGRVVTMAAGSTVFFAERVVALMTKFGLIAFGILMLRRSWLAWVVLLCVLVLSTADSAATVAWLMTPIPHGLRPAARAGRIFGRVSALALPPILYLFTLAYFLLPGTRREFARNGVGFNSAVQRENDDSRSSIHLPN